AAGTEACAGARRNSRATRSKATSRTGTTDTCSWGAVEISAIPQCIQPEVPACWFASCHPDFYAILVWSRDRRWPAWLDSSQRIRGVAVRIGSVIVIFAVLLLTLAAAAQSSVKEQSFSLPASTLQAMLKKLPGGPSGT